MNLHIFHDVVNNLRYNYEKFRFQLYIHMQHSDILTKTLWDLPGDYPKRVCLALLTVVCHPLSWRKRVRQSLKDYSDKRRRQEAPALSEPPLSLQELDAACSEIRHMFYQKAMKVAADDEFHDTKGKMLL